MASHLEAYDTMLRAEFFCFLCYGDSTVVVRPPSISQEGLKFYP